jgi:hypothetical protein
MIWKLAKQSQFPPVKPRGWISNSQSRAEHRSLPPCAGHARTPNGAEILLRREIGYDIRTYGCVGSSPPTQDRALGRGSPVRKGPPNAMHRVGDPNWMWEPRGLLGGVATVWSERPCGESVGANDDSPKERPLCSVSCYARAPGGDGRDSYLSRGYPRRAAALRALSPHGWACRLSGKEVARHESRVMGPQEAPQSPGTPIWVPKTHKSAFGSPIPIGIGKTANQEIGGPGAYIPNNTSR